MLLKNYLFWHDKMASHVAGTIAIIAHQLQQAEEAAESAPTQEYKLILSFYSSGEPQLVSSLTTTTASCESS
jgi:hypothetical protein